MAIQTINRGSSATAKDAEPLYEAWEKANDNFVELADALALKADLAFKAQGTLVVRSLLARFSDHANILDFGAIGDGASHPLSSKYATLAAAQVDYPFATSLTQEIDWAAIQAAINTGKPVYVPWSSAWYRLNAGLRMANHRQHMFGDGFYCSRLRFYTITGDDFVLGDTGDASQIYGLGLHDLSIEADGKTAGYSLAIRDCAVPELLDVYIGSPFNGIEVYHSNTVRLCNVDARGVRGAHALRLWGNGTRRSDVLIIANFVTDAGGGAKPDSIVWDGFGATLQILGARATRMGRGLKVENTLSLPFSQEPSFLYAFDYEVDFPEYECIRAEAGNRLNFYGLYAHGSVTENNIFIGDKVSDFNVFGGNITSAAKTGLDFRGLGGALFGVNVALNSQSAEATDDGIAVGATARSLDLVACKIGKKYGQGAVSQGRQRYGVSVASGAAAIKRLGGDWTGNATGEFSDPSRALDTGRELVVPLSAYAGAGLTWTAQPAADTLLLGSSRHIKRVDLAGFSRVRLTVNKQGTAGATGAKLHLRYATAVTFSAVNYLPLGMTAVSVAIDAVNTILDSGWIDLAPGAIGDVYLALIGSGGDGTLSPQFGDIVAEFR